MSCDKDVRALAVGKLISLNIDLQECGHVGEFYTKAHVHKKLGTKLRILMHDIWTEKCKMAKKAYKSDCAT